MRSPPDWLWDWVAGCPCVGVSWTALSYDGYHSVYNGNGTLRPWLPILCQAAAYPQHVTDCSVVP